MQTENPFLYNLLTPYDQIKFVNAFKTGLKILGKEKCWCMKKIKHSAFEGFNTSKKNKLQYQGRDARELLLHLTGREPTPEKSIIVRKGYCQSPYCLNPAHYYWGTRKDVAYENASINENSIDTFLISKLRKESQRGVSSRKLSMTYRLPYHSVRRICSYETYEDAENRNNDYNEKEIWNNLSEICEKISLSFPEESKKYKLNFLVNQQLECPWHIKDTKTHIGNFGIMGECLDCMKQIKNGRCIVDVREFDFRWYWQVKRFWEQVDVKDEDS